MLTELRNRGVRDVLIACCDGLAGLAEAIETVWHQTVVQTCVVHLIRAAMRFVSYTDRKAVTAMLKPVYTAANEAPRWRRWPLSPTLSWVNAIQGRSESGNARGSGSPRFLAFPPEVRRIIYTTNAVESLNYQLRKIIKNRGHFPNDDAVIKLLWLAIHDIEDKRARTREKDRGKSRSRWASGRLVEGLVVTGWKQALNALAIAYPGRLPEPL